MRRSRRRVRRPPMTPRCPAGTTRPWENGAAPSPGAQRQRIAIARALLPGLADHHLDLEGDHRTSCLDIGGARGDRRAGDRTLLTVSPQAAMRADRGRADHTESPQLAPRPRVGRTLSSFAPIGSVNPTAFDRLHAARRRPAGVSSTSAGQAGCTQAGVSRSGVLDSGGRGCSPQGRPDLATSQDRQAPAGRGRRDLPGAEWSGHRSSWPANGRRRPLRGSYGIWKAEDVCATTPSRRLVLLAGCAPGPAGGVRSPPVCSTQGRDSVPASAVVRRTDRECFGDGPLNRWSSPKPASVPRGAWGASSRHSCVDALKTSLTGCLTGIPFGRVHAFSSMRPQDFGRPCGAVRPCCPRMSSRSSRHRRPGGQPPRTLLRAHLADRLRPVRWLSHRPGLLPRGGPGLPGARPAGELRRAPTCARRRASGELAG